MNLPDSVRVLGKTYLVVPVEEGPLNPAVNLGQCLNADQVLYISTAQGDEQMLDTLLHELLHALEYAFALDLEERTVHSLATGLFALFRDNPALLGLFGVEEERQ